MEYDPDLVVSLQYAVMELALEVRELRERITKLEASHRMHVYSTGENAHKL